MWRGWRVVILQVSQKSPPRRGSAIIHLSGYPYMKAINKLSFYDQAAILVPGVIVLLSALFLIPDLRALLANDGITIGSLGFILIIAYAAGHSVAPIGRGVANILWRIRGGEPSG